MNCKQATLPMLARVTRAAALALGVALALPAWSQHHYPTPGAAADALVDGIARNDDDAVAVVLGSDWKKYIPDSPKSEDVTDFLAAWAKAHRIVEAGADKAWLEVGTHGWTMPIPLAKSAAGWSFDVKAAPEEMRTRRIGRNELAVIQVVLAYTDAQEDYARYTGGRNGKPVYAQKILSSAGKTDGLYWPSMPGEPESPLGPIIADAKPGEAYHGYRYRILTGQGKDAPGGAKSYVHGGMMSGGYALVAWPAKWDETGVMTFIVDQDRVVYQKDLGPNTDALARAMKAYNPDPTWQRAQAK